MVACSHVDTENTIAFEKIVKFASFPVELEAGEGTPVQLDCIGALEFRIADSLMVVTTSLKENAWKVYHLPEMTLRGEMLSVGPGPDELLMVPQVSMASINQSASGPMVEFADNARQRHYTLDLENSIDSGKTEMTWVEDPRLTPFNVYQNYLPEELTMLIDLDPMNARIERHFFKGGNQQVVAQLEYLNRYSAESMDNIGLLMPCMLINPVEGKVAEVYNVYPQINLYSLSNDEAVTLAPQGKLESFVPLKGKPFNEWPTYYRNGMAYNDCFVVQKVEPEGYKLWFFSWEGKPLLSLKIDAPFTTFDIDFKGTTLYTMNFPTETMTKYSIKEAIRHLSH